MISQYCSLIRFGEFFDTISTLFGDLTSALEGEGQQKIGYFPSKLQIINSEKNPFFAFSLAYSHCVCIVHTEMLKR